MKILEWLGLRTSKETTEKYDYNMHRCKSLRTRIQEKTNTIENKHDEKVLMTSLNDLDKLILEIEVSKLYSISERIRRLDNAYFFASTDMNAIRMGESTKRHLEKYKRGNIRYSQLSNLLDMEMSIYNAKEDILIHATTR